MIGSAFSQCPLHFAVLFHRHPSTFPSFPALTLTRETNLATLRHLFYSSAIDWRLCEEGYYVVQVEYFGMGCDSLASIRMQQVHR